MTAPTAPATSPAAAAADQGRPDLRPGVLAAQEWVADLLANVRPDQRHAPTPCSEYDVEDLLKHLFGVANRVVALGSGQPAESVPPTVETLPSDVVAAYRERMEQGRLAWADPASLDRLLEVPWGRAPGAVVLGVYLAENLTHGWDLARATGQPSEADPALVAPAYATMQRALPAAGREDYPFEAPVTPATDAGPTERLANWSGRTSR